ADEGAFEVIAESGAARGSRKVPVGARGENPVAADLTGLQVTFDEPVLGADQIGSYRVLAAGPDGDFSTASCAAALGDDIERPLASVSSDLDPTTPTITLLLDGRLPTDLIRLIVCETIEDLGTLPLDGDGDGVGGDPFVQTFRVDPYNLFSNGDFDRCPVTLNPWTVVATPPDVVSASESEDATASTLSGSARILSASAASSAIAQCVEIEQPAPRLDLNLAARLDAPGTATASLDIGCDFFDLSACGGPSSASDTASATLSGPTGSWSHQLFFLEPLPTAASALCSVVVTPDQPSDPVFDAYLDRLSLVRSLVFVDGFETGGTGAWSQAVGVRDHP
ncbi:MAG: hypothetical protein AAGD06_33615, partial [Acidobacteriota bacterium]